MYPYLCDASSDEVVCTYDHLSKVHAIMNISDKLSCPVVAQGNCSTRWPGFDSCPVAIAYEPEHYCRTKLDITVSC